MKSLLSSHFWISFAVCLSGLGLLGFTDSEEATQRTSSSQSPPESFESAIALLQGTERGRVLLNQAVQKLAVENPTRLFEWGEESRTDAVISRRLDPQTGDEIRERKTRIFLRKNQRLSDLVLDMAHELTHAIAPAAWDPYDPDLTAFRYLKTSIEGAGGEVEALFHECEVGLAALDEHTDSIARCKRYWDPITRKVDRDLILKDFYRVGAWKSFIQKELGAQQTLDLPFLSAEAPALYSSTGRAPYPAALIREYSELTRTACENSRRRLDSKRTPSNVRLAESLERSRLLLERRCVASRNSPRR